MSFFALTPRSFPVKIAHPEDPSIDWLKTAEKMDLYEQPATPPEDDQSKYDEALRMARAARAARDRYQTSLNIEDLELKNGAGLHLFEVSVIPDAVRRERHIRALSDASRRKDANKEAAETDLYWWAYDNYVTPPKGFGFNDPIRIDMGRTVFALSVTSISTEHSDDVGK